MDNVRLIAEIVHYLGMRGQVAVSDSPVGPVCAVFSVTNWKTARGDIRRGVEAVAVVPHFGVVEPRARVLA
jgi:hypothetical protein